MHVIEKFFPTPLKNRGVITNEFGILKSGSTPLLVVSKFQIPLTHRTENGYLTEILLKSFSVVSALRLLKMERQPIQIFRMNKN